MYNIQCTLYNTGCAIYNVYLVGEIQQRERAGKPQATFISHLEKDKTEEGHIVGGGRREGCLDGDEAGVGGKLGGKWRPPSAHSPPLTASSDTSTTHTTSYSCPLENGGRFPLLLVSEQLPEETRETEESYFPIG